MLIHPILALISKEYASFAWDLRTNVDKFDGKYRKSTTWAKISYSYKTRDSHLMRELKRKPLKNKIYVNIN